MWMKHIVREDFPGISTGQHRQRADTGGSAALKHSGKPRRDLVRSDLDHTLIALSKRSSAGDLWGNHLARQKHGSHVFYKSRVPEN